MIQLLSGAGGRWHVSSAARRCEQEITKTSMNGNAPGSGTNGDTRAAVEHVSQIWKRRGIPAPVAHRYAVGRQRTPPLPTNQREAAEERWYSRRPPHDAAAPPGVTAREGCFSVFLPGTAALLQKQQLNAASGTPASLSPLLTSCRIDSHAAHAYICPPRRMKVEGRIYKRYATAHVLFFHGVAVRVNVLVCRSSMRRKAMPTMVAAIQPRHEP